MRPIQNGRHFADTVSKIIFLKENRCIWFKFPLNSIPMDPITIDQANYSVSVGKGNGLALNRRHAIIWTNRVIFYWCIWGRLRQKQVSQAWISNYIPENAVGCNYFSLSESLLLDPKYPCMSHPASMRQSIFNLFLRPFRCNNRSHRILVRVVDLCILSDNFDFIVSTT